MVLLLFSSTISFAYYNRLSDFDTSLVSGMEYFYHEPNKILFTQIEGNYEQISLNSGEYLNLLYYYSITKLKLGNIPFHYAVDESGIVYKTQNYDSIKITDDNYIVIAYLSNNGQVTNSAAISSEKLIEELAYKYRLTEIDIFSYQIEQDEQSFSKLSLIEPTQLFSDSITSLFIDWEPSERENLEYKARIEDVEYDESVEIGKHLEVKVVIKNDSDFVWTSDRDPIYISVKDSEESPYAVNVEWESFSKPLSFDSDTTLLPGDTLELTFSLDPKVLPGENREVFNLLKFDGEVFEGSEFEVNFTVDKGDKILVEVDSPEYGFVNIRKCKFFSCEVMSIANDGEVYIMVEEDSCWYKILFDQDREGWIYCRYANKL